MLILDRIMAGTLILLGTIHNFVAAPMSFDRLSTGTLWFAAAGLALWYAGFINLIRSEPVYRGRLSAAVCFLTNLTLLGFVVLFAGLRDGSWYDPQALLLIGTVATLTVTSTITLWQVFGLSDRR